MTQTIARIKKIGKHFEIVVDMESALKFRKEGIGNSGSFLEAETIFTDAKKGERASAKELKEAFETEDVSVIAEKIVKAGEILVTQEHRSAEQEARFKQVVDFFSKNAIDPKTGNSIPTERIKNALEQIHLNIKNTPIENQITEILEPLSRVIPIRLERKKIKITIPAQFTGSAYGIVQQYKESENWKNNGDLEVEVNIPSGVLLNFYDKLNSITHGSALTEEVKK